MRKLVYLFELDSVRNSDKQMKLAMKALFREIVVNGNSVAVTFNQLIDSRFFLSLINDNRWADHIVSLFRSGGIRISQFGQYRTAAQYLIGQALDSKEEYIFSGLPIRSGQKSLIALVKRSLKYSDITELNEYINGFRTDNERETLFRERDENNVIQDTKLNKDDMLNTLRDLQAVVKLILKVGGVQEAYNQPKDFKPSNEGLDLKSFLKCVVSFIPPNEYPKWNETIVLLNDISEGKYDNQFKTYFGKKDFDKNKRSEILKLIRKLYEDSGDLEGNFEIYALAHAIVDLCYNYTCEASICNASRHYDIDELKKFHERTISNKSRESVGTKEPEISEEVKPESFREDFLSQLHRYYGDKGSRKERFLKPESNDFIPYNFSKPPFFHIENAAYLSKYARDIEQDNKSDELPLYENGLLLQRLKQWWANLKQVGIDFIWAFLFSSVLFGVYKAIRTYDPLQLGFTQTDQFGFTALFYSFLLSYSLCFLIYWLTLAGQKHTKDYTRQDQTEHNISRFKALTYNESITRVFVFSSVGICVLVKGFLGLMCIGVPYSNKKNTSKSTPREKTKKINYVSKRVSDYVKFRKSQKDQGREWLFDDSKYLPLIDIKEYSEDDSEDSWTDVRLTRIEELTGKDFGIAYDSQYHKMLVDPLSRVNIISNPTDNNVYPYERLVPTSDKPGVVTVPIIKDEKGNTLFVLIKQFRHAIRREQYSFPRGFGEKDLDVFHNAQKELYEEIRAVLKDPNTGKRIEYSEKEPKQSDDPTPSLLELGKITPDSGSLCDTISVVQANLDSYSVQIGHEGIIDCIKVTESDLDKMNKKGEIDDGFTVAAFLLWKLENE